MLDLPDGFRQILDLLEAAEDEEPRDPGPGPALTTLLTATQTLVERLPEVADAHYLRGYALFLLSRQGVAVARESLSEMVAAMRLAPTHQWARYHAVVLCHEKGEHDAVTEHFEAMDRDFFAGQDKDWRYLVAWQYAIDSQLRLGRAHRFETELRHLVQAYLSYSDDPDELLPRPGLLIRLEHDLLGERLETLRAPEAESCARLLHEQLGLLVPGGWVIRAPNPAGGGP